MPTPLLAALLFQLPVLPPQVGEQAPAFKVNTLDNKSVELRRLLRNGPVVLVVLRGFPGYQCPFCTRQVGELIQRASDFGTSKATVVFVYPGPAEHLKEEAAEFVNGVTIPANFRFTLDPDFKFTESYHLRWNAPGETAYPSTFVISPKGKITFAKVSHSHGDRSSVSEILSALK